MSKKLLLIIANVATTLCCALVFGCANQMHSVVVPEYQSKIIEVSSIAVTGEGSSIAVPALISRGYKIKDIPSGSGDLVEIAKSNGIPFIASVDRVGTDESIWNGFFKYSMHVTETRTRTVVWSADGKYGKGGVFINQVDSNNDAMREMVADFAKSFPPKT